ncbi:MAG: capsular polysaccharide biosynthesis protein [Roseinatronobacter sp.]
MSRLGRVFAYSGGFWGPSSTARRLRLILREAGLPLRAGWPKAGDRVAVWGHAPRATRGEWVAARSGARLIRLEDAFLRSLQPGRLGEPPLGLLIDQTGVHYDPQHPSDLETLLATHPFDDHALIAAAREGIARLTHLGFGKYAGHDPDAALPEPGYVLVVDQVRGDASLAHGGLHGALSPHVFREMLVQAQLDWPGTRIVIKTHPETAKGLRAGHFGQGDATGNITLLTEAVAPYPLLTGALAVYTVSSQMGFEAILAGHRPQVFGLPFYAGWGLTDDQIPHPRRRRKLTRTQLFAGAMLLYPRWFDPNRGRLCSFGEALDHLEALVRAWREDRGGHVGLNMRAWKRGHLQAMFGQWKPVRFQPMADRPVMVWGAAPAPEGTARLEDGFLRSRGLGAELTPPLSLIRDPMGLYYDPARPSLIEHHMTQPLPPGGEARAERLRARINASGVSKYNLPGARPEMPEGHRILVPGQVEDDASIRLGAGAVRTNRALLEAVRAANSDAVIVYKPHPDVEAGLRPGACVTDGLADLVLTKADPVWLLDQVQEVWTITSTLGFEALLRGVPVTTLGAPFYSGWGLTRDLGPVPARRAGHRVSLPALVHAALIAAPRYHDPISNLPCPPEVALERLIHGPLPRPPALRALAKLQGALASYAHLWR